MTTLYQQLHNTATKKPKDISVVFYGKRYSFKTMLALVDKAAAGLKAMGIKKGDVVTLCLPNTPSAQIAFYALNRLGAVVGLVHPYTAPPQLCKNLAETGSRLLIVYDLYLREKGHLLNTDVKILNSLSDYFMSRLARLYFRYTNRKKPRFDCDVFEDLFDFDALTDPPHQAGDNDPAVYLPSGGTCGTPKIIMHNNAVFDRLCSHAQYFLSEPIQNYKAMYSVLPIFHGFGLCMNMHMCCVFGLKNVMSIRFSPAAMARAIKKEGINVITGVPAMYSRLLACKQFLRADLSSVKDCFVGGDSAPKRLVDDFDAVLQKKGSTGRLYVGYGLAETIAVCIVNCKNMNRRDSVGYPLPGTKVMIVDGDKPLPAGEIGEIALSTPQLMLGYLDGGETIKNINGQNWLLTGDLGYTDADGFLYFKQRAKNVLKVSGVPVYPCEIEEVAEGVPGVIRAAAVGIDDARWGQAVKLYVESKQPDTQALKAKIIEECKLKLMKYAVPKAIEIRQSLPLNDIGKIDKKQLV